MSPGHTLSQNCRSNHVMPKSSRKTQIETQCYTVPFKSHSVLYPRSPQPSASPSSVSLAHQYRFLTQPQLPLYLTPSSSRFTLTFEHNHHKKSNCAVRACVRVLYAVRLLPIKRRKLCVYVTKSQAKRCFWVGLIGPTWPDGCEAFCVHLWMFV